jgi:hypothetical protein
MGGSVGPHRPRKIYKHAPTVRYSVVLNCKLAVPFVNVCPVGAKIHSTPKFDNKGPTFVSVGRLAFATE